MSTPYHAAVEIDRYSNAAPISSCVVQNTYPEEPKPEKSPERIAYEERIANDPEYHAQQARAAAKRKEAQERAAQKPATVSNRIGNENCSLVVRCLSLISLGDVVPTVAIHVGASACSIRRSAIHSARVHPAARRNSREPGASTS